MPEMVLPAHSDRATDNVYPDGSLRCDTAFHAVKPGPGDMVPVRVQFMIPGDQLASLNRDWLRSDLVSSLRATDVQPVEISRDGDLVDIKVFAPEHDCDRR